MNHVENLHGIASYLGCDAEAEYSEQALGAADHIEQLEALVNSLDIQVMQPSMDGRHQYSIRANGRLLTTEQWDLILTCRFADGAP